MKDKILGFFIGLSLVASGAFAQDWFEATGVPVARSALNSADLRTEFASIETDIADKLPALTGNGDRVVVVNAGGTALTVATTGIAVTGGGTGSTTAAGARTNLGLAIGTDVQAYDADLTAIAALANTDGNIIAGNGSAWVAESGATARASLGANDAANLTTGELPDARLSSNVALLDQTNTFTNNVATMDGAGPQWRLNESDQAANNRLWLLQSSGEAFLIRGCNDVVSVCGDAVRIDRTGTTIDEVDLTATTLDFNGNVDISGTLTRATNTVWDTANDGAGSGLDADLLDGSSSAAFLQASNNLSDVSSAATARTNLGVPDTESGTFTASFDTACTTTQNITIDYQRNGNIVVMEIGADSAPTACTSNSMNYSTTGTPVPSAIRPSNVLHFPIYGDFENNGSATAGKVSLSTTGNILAWICASGSCTSAGWTNSGDKNFPLSGFTITYMLGDPS